MSLHCSKNAKTTIENAKKQFQEDLKKGKGTKIELNNETLFISDAFLNLVKNLNPKDDEKRKAITNELFGESK